MKKTQYDPIAEDYARSQLEKPNRVYAYEHTFFKILGGVQGSKVLDLACGDGLITRKVYRNGASQVIGVDESEEIIKLARKTSPAQIAYRVGKVGEIGKIGDFDFVTAGFLFHYANSIPELEAMFEDVSRNLKDGGRLVALNNHPANPITPNWQHGTAVKCLDGKLVEGAELQVSIYEGEKVACTFNQRYWLQSTYETAMKKAGFRSWAWHELEVSQEGIKRFGREFWEPFIKNPGVIVLEARK